MQTKQDVLMESLSNFYAKPANINKLLSVVMGNSTIKLRILDWFVTNYSRKYDIQYDVTNNCGKTKKYGVYLDYKAQLKAYSKKQFDPFCRRERISFIYKDNKELETTVGQLNFFRWAIENNVIEFVKDNLNVIEEDMNNSTPHLRIKPKDGVKRTRMSRKERDSLFMAITKKETKKDVKITVEF